MLFIIYLILNFIDLWKYNKLRNELNSELEKLNEEEKVLVIKEIL
jgi:hypothetical protein